MFSVIYHLSQYKLFCSEQLWLDGVLPKTKVSLYGFLSLNGKKVITI